LGDEAAAECIRRGAADYILKDRLGRLASAIESAVQQKPLRDRQAESKEALYASERRFRSVFDSGPSALAILNSAGRIIEVNKAFLQLTGYTASSLRNRHVLSLADPADAHLLLKAWRALRKGVRVSKPMLTSFTGGEKVIRLKVTLSRLEVDSSTDSFALLVAQEQGRESQAEEEGKRSNRILHAVSRAAQLFLDPLTLQTAQADLLQLLGEAASAEAALILQTASRSGYALSRKWERHKRNKQIDYSKPVMAFLENAAGRLPRVPIAVPLQATPNAIVRHPPYGTSTIEAALLPIHIHKVLWGYIALVRSSPTLAWSEVEMLACQAAADLFGSAIHDAQNDSALRASELRHRLLIEASLDAIISTDKDGFITGWNRSAEAMFGYHTDEVTGQPVLSVVAPADNHSEWRRGGVEPRSSHAANLRGHRFESTAIRRDGTRFPVEVAVSSAPSDDGPILSVVVRDTTQSRQAEQALEASREERERVARHIQDALLLGDLSFPEPRFDFAFEAQAGGAISGDFVWTLTHSENVADVAMGDVMGKGLMAALLGAITKNTVHEAMQRLVGYLQPFKRLPYPHEVVSAIHKSMSSELAALESFVTFIYARFDHAARRCTFVDCGHTGLAYVNARSGAFALISGEDMPIGFTPHSLFQPVTVPFEPGDLFLLYSDGVIEAQNADQQFFGTSRLKHVLSSCVGIPAAAVVRQVVEAVNSFCEPARPSDDVTCVAIVIARDIETPVVATAALEIPSHPEELEKVRATVEEFCHRSCARDLTDQDIAMLSLAAHEATRNVIEHAHQQRPDMSVRLTAEAYPDRVEIVVYDMGPGFSLDAVPEPDLLRCDRPSLGVYLMKQAVDRVEYTSPPSGGNALRLVKYRSRLQRPQD
jgi:sigma-B regulation protein RsbU (phosphoserine phosphatase)